MSSNELISEFFESSLPELEGLSLEEVKLICTAEFTMLKDVMQSGTLEDVRLQYLFVAKVSAPRVVRTLESIYSKKALGKISEKAFNKYSEMLIEHIKSNPKKFRKYEQRIRQTLVDL